MSMTKSPIRPMVKAATSIPHLLLMGCLLSCSPASRSRHDQNISDIGVSAATYTGRSGNPLEPACAAWSLSPAEVRRVLELSQSYQTSPYSGFYQLPCAISGTIREEGRVWDFELNGGGVVKLTSGQETKYMGCRDNQCEPYILLLTDDMAGN